jgi:hypothetical protein
VNVAVLDPVRITNPVAVSVGIGTFEVNGTLLPLMADAPEKEGRVLGMPIVLCGLRTLRLVRIR